MYHPRSTEGQTNWLDETGTKIYTVSSANCAVEQSKYLPRLKEVKLALKY